MQVPVWNFLIGRALTKIRSAFILSHIMILEAEPLPETIYIDKYLWYTVIVVLYLGFKEVVNQVP